MSEYRIRRKRAPAKPVFADAEVSHKELVRAFAKRLQKAMDAKGWSQSDLARQASLFLERSDPEDKTQVTRDNISKYMVGKMLPRGPRLTAIAKALDVSVEDLTSTEGMASVDRAPKLMVMETNDGLLFLRVNQALPRKVAMQILALLGEHTE